MLVCWGWTVLWCATSAEQRAGAARASVCRAVKSRLDLVNPGHDSLSKAAMETVNIYEAKTRLSQLVDKAASGEDVVVSRNGKTLVRITQLEGTRRPIKFGVLKGKLRIAPDFDAPLPDEILAGFEGR